MDNEEGGYNPGHLWKLRQKLSPRPSEPPTAMKNKEGKLLTSEDDIKDEAVKHYKNVFKNSAIDEEFKPHEIEREELCKLRLKSAYENKTPHHNGRLQM